MMERGEIRWYKFKPPDKERPVVILTRDTAMITKFSETKMTQLKSAMLFAFGFDD